MANDTGKPLKELQTEPVPADATLVTRKQAASMLGRTPRAVQHLHESGRLEAVRRGPDKAYWYRKADVERLIPWVQSQPRAPRSRDGKLAAQVFTGLREGKAVRDLVIELEQPPGIIQQLARSYAEPDEYILPAEAVRELRQILSQCGMDWGWRSVVALCQLALAAEQKKLAEALAQAVSPDRPKKRSRGS